MGGTKKSLGRLSPTVEDPPPSDRRVRVADWMAVLKLCDENQGSWVKVGKFDASVGTHIREGRYSYIDPNVYDVKQAKIEGSKTKSPVWIFLMRRP